MHSCGGARHRPAPGNDARRHADHRARHRPDAGIEPLCRDRRSRAGPRPGAAGLLCRDRGAAQAERRSRPGGPHPWPQPPRLRTAETMRDGHRPQDGAVRPPRTQGRLRAAGQRPPGPAPDDGPAHAAHLPPFDPAAGLLPAALGARSDRSGYPPAVPRARLGQDAHQMARHRCHPRGLRRRYPAGRLAHHAQRNLRTEPLQDVAIHRTDRNPVNLFRAAGAMAADSLSPRACRGDGSVPECHASGPPLSSPAHAGAATAGGTASSRPPCVSGTASY